MSVETSETVILLLTGAGITMFGMIVGVTICWMNFKRWSR